MLFWYLRIIETGKLSLNEMVEMLVELKHYKVWGAVKKVVKLDNYGVEELLILIKALAHVNFPDEDREIYNMWTLVANKITPQYLLSKAQQGEHFPSMVWEKVLTPKVLEHLEPHGMQIVLEKNYCYSTLEELKKKLRLRSYFNERQLVDILKHLVTVRKHDEEDDPLCQMIYDKLMGK